MVELFFIPGDHDQPRMDCGCFNLAINDGIGRGMTTCPLLDIVVIAP